MARPIPVVIAVLLFVSPTLAEVPRSEAASHYLAGLAAYNAGDSDTAISEYEEALKLKPTSIPTKDALIRARNDKVAELEKKLASMPSAGTLPPEAKKLATPPAPSAETPRSPAAGKYLAGLEAYRCGDLDTAISNYEEALKLKPTSSPCKDALLLALSDKTAELEKRLALARTAAVTSPPTPKEAPEYTMPSHAEASADAEVAAGKDQPVSQPKELKADPPSKKNSGPVFHALQSTAAQSRMMQSASAMRRNTGRIYSYPRTYRVTKWRTTPKTTPRVKTRPVTSKATARRTFASTTQRRPAPTTSRPPTPGGGCGCVRTPRK